MDNIQDRQIIQEADPSLRSSNPLFRKTALFLAGVACVSACSGGAGPNNLASEELPVATTVTEVVGDEVVSSEAIKEPESAIESNSENQNLLSQVNSEADVTKSDILPEFWTPAVIEGVNGEILISEGISMIFNRSVALFREAVASGDMSLIDNVIAESDEYPDQHDKIYKELADFLFDPMKSCVELDKGCTWDNFNENIPEGRQYQQFITNSDGSRAEYTDHFRLKSGSGDDEKIMWEGYIRFQAENNDTSDPFGWKILRFEPFTINE